MTTTADTTDEHPTPWFTAIIRGRQTFIADANGAHVCIAPNEAAAERIVISVNRYAAAYPRFKPCPK